MELNVTSAPIGNEISNAELGLFLPANASVLTRLRVAYRALRVLEKQPENTVAGRCLSASLDRETFRRHAADLAQTELGRTLFSEQPTLQRGKVDLGALKQLPEGTLGRAFAQYFLDNAIQPFESPYEVLDNSDFLVKWYRETHDLHHLVTGYGTDPVGEMEVQAFVLGNLGFRTCMLILTFAALLRPRGMPSIWSYWKRLRIAYRRGKQSANLFSVRYDHYFEQPVQTIRTALHVPSLPRF